MNKLKFAFIVTNYNNSYYTKKLVESVNQIKLDGAICYIVVVDNNSNLENIIELNKIEEEASNLKVLYQKVNLGYFKGLNIGLKYLKELDSEIKFSLIGNNDLSFNNNFLDELKENIELFNRYPVVSPNIVDHNGVHQNPHVVKSVSKFREFIYDLYYSNYTLSKIILTISRYTYYFTDRADESKHNIAAEIYQGHGSCYLLGPLFFKNFNELFAPTFLMGEEFFLAYQLKQKKYSVYYTPNIKIKHYGHASLKNVPSKKIWKIAKDSHNVYRKYLRLYKEL